MKKLSLILLLSFCGTALIGQSVFFYVQLKDKNATPFSFSAPEEYLSQRALERRAAMNIALDSTDFPPNPVYVSAIKNTGAEVFALTRWLNGVVVRTADSTVVAPLLRTLSCVDFVEYTGLDVPLPAALPAAVRRNSIALSASDTSTYAAAFAQIAQLNGLALHQRGYRGAGVYVAVIDAGFTNADTHLAFDSLYATGRLLGTKDFAYQTANVFDTNTHGASVLSTMATNLPNCYIGTAPDASYWLLRTERTAGEYPIEADLWIAAAEFADSAGADLLTTSLGYSTFDDAALNYSYTQLDGNTIRASRAASMAAQKGMLALNAAGNEGNGAWHYISVPGDAHNVLTVGAVDASGTPAAFSSYGPLTDGRVKPEVSARGSGTAVGNMYGSSEFTVGSGTSYATPVLAGVCASLIGALKNNAVAFTPAEVIDAICRSASGYGNPQAQTGYGIPNFATVMDCFITTKNNDNQIENNYFLLNETVDKFVFYFNIKNVKLLFCDVTGRTVARITTSSNEIAVDKNSLPKGILLVFASDDAGFWQAKKIRH